MHAVKYSESSLIATMYTEVFGRQSFIINGARSKNSPLKAVLFQPLYLLDLEMYYHEGKEIQRLKNARIAQPYSGIPFDIRKSTQVLFLSELLYKCLRELEPNSELFEFIYHSLTFLDLTETGVNNFHLWFLVKLTRYLGISPNQENSKTSNFFDLQNAHFVSHEPIHNQFADKQITILFSKLFEVEIGSIDQLRYTSDERKLVMEKLLDYYRIHFNNFGEIRSLTVLREVLK